MALTRSWSLWFAASSPRPVADIEDDTLTIFIVLLTRSKLFLIAEWHEDDSKPELDLDNNEYVTKRSLIKQATLSHWITLSNSCTTVLHLSIYLSTCVCMYLSIYVWFALLACAKSPNTSRIGAQSETEPQSKNSCDPWNPASVITRISVVLTCRREVMLGLSVDTRWRVVVANERYNIVFLIRVEQNRILIDQESSANSHINRLTRAQDVYICSYSQRIVRATFKLLVPFSLGPLHRAPQC